MPVVKVEEDNRKFLPTSLKDSLDPGCQTTPVPSAHEVKKQNPPPSSNTTETDAGLKSPDTVVKVPTENMISTIRNKDPKSMLSGEAAPFSDSATTFNNCT